MRSLLLVVLAVSSSAHAFVFAGNAHARVRTLEDVNMLVEHLAGLDVTIDPNESIRVAPAR